MYGQYALALTTPRREALAGFYDRVDVVRVLNGTRSVMTRAQLDSIYRGPWNPPEFFAWDSLRYDAMGPGFVLVSGGFRWRGKTRPDTARFLYSAVLQSIDSGLVIRAELETARPPEKPR